MFIFLVTLTACQNRTPLGLRNGLIRNDQITASSTFQNKLSFAPHFARLDNPLRWCSEVKKEIQEEYLQVCQFYYTVAFFSRMIFPRSKRDYEIVRLHYEICVIFRYEIWELETRFRQISLYFICRNTSFAV